MELRNGQRTNGRIFSILFLIFVTCCSAGTLENSMGLTALTQSIGCKSRRMNYKSYLILNIGWQGIANVSSTSSVHTMICIQRSRRGQDDTTQMEDHKTKRLSPLELTASSQLEGTTLCITNQPNAYLIILGMIIAMHSSLSLWARNG